MIYVFHIRRVQSFCIINNIDTQPYYTLVHGLHLSINLGWISRRVTVESMGIKLFNFATYLVSFLPLYFSCSLNISITEHWEYNTPSLHVCKHLRNKSFTSVINSQIWLSLTTLCFSFFFFFYETVFERILILFWEVFLFLEFFFFFFLLQEKLGQLDCCQGDYNPRKKER